MDIDELKKKERESIYSNIKILVNRGYIKRSEFIKVLRGSLITKRTIEDLKTIAKKINPVYIYFHDNDIEFFTKILIELSKDDMFDLYLKFLKIVEENKEKDLKELNNIIINFLDEEIWNKRINNYGFSSFQMDLSKNHSIAYYYAQTIFVWSLIVPFIRYSDLQITRTEIEKIKNELVLYDLENNINSIELLDYIFLEANIKEEYKLDRILKNEK